MSIRNPSIQFFAVLIGSPLFAILGVSLGGDLPAAAGLFLTLASVSLAGLRSYRHERARLPAEPLVRQIGGPNSILIRYLAGVLTLIALTSLGTVVLGGVVVGMVLR
ncbi:MAG TPA: hypothetical protein VMN57_06440 [Anaerolineales bacterium]|nr:hypothetical protein [Anaerolineales bacterium]